MEPIELIGIWEIRDHFTSVRKMHQGENSYELTLMQFISGGVKTDDLRHFGSGGYLIAAFAFL